MKTKLYRESLLFVILLIASMIVVISNVVFMKDFQSMEYRASTFEKTSFEIILNNPSFSQLDDLEENEHILGQYPILNMCVTVMGDKTHDMNVMIGLNDSKELGFFNEDTLIKGSIEKEGIELDQTAANELGASIGDIVTVLLNGSAFDFEVTAIHMPVHYVSLSRGVGNIIATEAILDSFSIDYKVDMSFIHTDDITQSLNDDLKHYIPMGRLLDEAAFSELYQNSNAKPNNMTESEWNDLIASEYDIYITNFLSSEYSNDVILKQSSGSIILNQTESGRTKNIIYIFSGTLILTIVLAYFNAQQVSSGENFYQDLIKKTNQRYVKNKLLVYFTTRYLLAYIMVMIIMGIFGLIVYKNSYVWTSYISISILYISMTIFMCIFITKYIAKIKKYNKK